MAVSRPERPIRIIGPLLCDACRSESRQRAKGWQAFHLREEDDRICVLVFCPDCLELEFGTDEDTSLLREQD